MSENAETDSQALKKEIAQIKTEMETCKLALDESRSETENYKKAVIERNEEIMEMSGRLEGREREFKRICEDLADASRKNGEYPSFSSLLFFLFFFSLSSIYISFFLLIYYEL